MISESDAERLAVALSKALQQARSVSDSEHFDHHAWVKTQIEREILRAKFWRDMTAHIAKLGAWSLLTAVFYALYLGIRQLARVNL